MAIETIKCQECGSADVTEFKPGSYVCSHCEAVFKYVDPSKVSQEQCDCGTFAVGHCTECSVPVCDAHSALWEGSRLCYSHWNERETARTQARIEARMTVGRFIELAAAVGNPGIRSWPVKEFESITPKRKGSMFARNTVKDDWVEKYRLNGWILLHARPLFRYMVSTEGQINYLNWSTSSMGEVTDHSWDEDWVRESKVEFDCANRIDPDALSDYLHKLSESIGLTIPEWRSQGTP